MAEVIHTHGTRDGLPRTSYGATAPVYSRIGVMWRASVFLLAGALIVLSAIFGSNDDSSTGASPDVSAVATR